MSSPCETDVESWLGSTVASELKMYGLARSPMPMNSAPSSARMPPSATHSCPSTVKSLGLPASRRARV